MAWSSRSRMPAPSSRHCAGGRSRRPGSAMRGHGWVGGGSRAGGRKTTRAKRREWPRPAARRRSGASGAPLRGCDRGAGRGRACCRTIRGAARVGPAPLHGCRDPGPAAVRLAAPTRCGRRSLGSAPSERLASAARVREALDREHVGRDWEKDQALDYLVARQAAADRGAGRALPPRRAGVLCLCGLGRGRPRG